MLLKVLTGCKAVEYNETIFAFLIFVSRFIAFFNKVFINKSKCSNIQLHHKTKKKMLNKLESALIIYQALLILSIFIIQFLTSHLPFPCLQKKNDLILKLVLGIWSEFRNNQSFVIFQRHTL